MGEASRVFAEYESGVDCVKRCQDRDDASKKKSAISDEGVWQPSRRLGNGVRACRNAKCVDAHSRA